MEVSNIELSNGAIITSTKSFNKGKYYFFEYHKLKAYFHKVLLSCSSDEYIISHEEYSVSYKIIKLKLIQKVADLYYVEIFTIEISNNDINKLLNIGLISKEKIKEIGLWRDEDEEK